jgi:hypothetical protein
MFILNCSFYYVNLFFFFWLGVATIEVSRDTMPPLYFVLVLHVMNLQLCSISQVCHRP